MHFKAAQFPDPVDSHVGEVIRLDGDFDWCFGNGDQLFQFFYPSCQLRPPGLDVPGFTD